MDEQDFEWAQKYLTHLGYKVEQNLATQEFSILKKDASLADTAVIRDDGEMLVSFKITMPNGTNRILRPQQIVVVAQSLYDKHGDILV